jgi:hypothetical protein
MYVIPGVPCDEEVSGEAPTTPTRTEIVADLRGRSGGSFFWLGVHCVLAFSFCRKRCENKSKKSFAGIKII